MYPLRTASTLIWFSGFCCALYLGATYWLPSAEGEPVRPPSVRELARAVLSAPAEPSAPALPTALGGADLAPPPPEPAPPRPGAPGQGSPFLEAPQGALDPLYTSLQATAAPGSKTITRVLHWGDSMLTGDGISDALRGELQARFGDAGHGFILPGPPWRWYHHQGITSRLAPPTGFRVNRITANPMPDGAFGLGGVAFRTFQTGARAIIEPETRGAVDRYEVLYLAHPRGGALEVQLDQGAPVTIQTQAPTTTSRSFTVAVTGRGPARLTVTYAGGGEVRLFGVAAERGEAGVVYDSLGINGLHAANFTRFNAAHLAEQVSHRAPALLVVMLGTNESQNQQLDLGRHGEDYARMLALIRRGAPRAACLVVSPPDRASRGWRSSALIGQIVARQREVALEEGCAFWNTFEAMGGAGSASRWRRLRPPLLGGDLIHPTPEGARRIGASIGQALLAGYDRWLSHQRRPPAGQNRAE